MNFKLKTCISRFFGISIFPHILVQTEENTFQAINFNSFQDFSLSSKALLYYFIRLNYCGTPNSLFAFSILVQSSFNRIRSNCTNIQEQINRVKIARFCFTIVYLFSWKKRQERSLLWSDSTSLFNHFLVQDFLPLLVKHIFFFFFLFRNTKFFDK